VQLRFAINYFLSLNNSFFLIKKDDTTMIERILKRVEETDGERADDNIQTALKRIKAYHKAERPVKEWLMDNCIPIVRLDCNGTQENVWNQLLAIGRLMRLASTNQTSR